MEIRLLGPVEVERDGTRAALGGAKQKALLVLLAQARQVVPTEGLIDALWPGDPPRSAVNVVQTYVYRLRRALGPDVIVARKPGYLLDVDADAIDLTRARRLAAESRRARAAGRDHEAAAGFRTALALFRGRPLADVCDEPALQDLAASLDALRLELHEEAADAELACGAGAELVDELTTLAREQPWREHLHGQLMIALARAGRQADALATYRSLQMALAADLGVDPSPELRELEGRILRQDPTLTATGPPRRTRHAGTGAVPAPMTGLVGRERELRDLDELVRRRGVRLVTLTGPGGVGKTRLAVALLRQLAESGPTGREVSWVELAPVSRVADVLPAIGRALGLPSLEAPDPVGQVVDAVAGRPTLLALDNLEHVTDIAPTVVELLTRAPQLVVLATSRRPLDVYGEWLYPVPTLPVDDAVALLVERTRGLVPGWAPAAGETAALEAVCRGVDGLPLAIELVAPGLRYDAPARLAAVLDASLDGIPGGPQGVHARHRSLRGTLEWSRQLLDADQDHALGRLATFAGDFDLAAAAAVCGVEDAMPLVQTLIDHSLLQAVTHRPLRCRMLRVVQDLARQWLPPEQSRAARDAHAQYFLQLAAAARPAHPGSWPDEQAAATLDPYVDDLDRALRWLARRGQCDDLALAASLWPYWHLRGHLTVAEHWLRPALDDARAVDAVRAHALLGLAWTFLSRGDAEAQVAAAEAARCFRSHGKPAELGAALTVCAASVALGGDRDQARELFREAAETSRAAGDDITLSHALLNWADLEITDGRPDLARGLLQEALDVAPESGRAALLPALLVNVAYAQLAESDDCAAVASLRKAVTVGGATPHASLHLAVLVALASVAATRGLGEVAATLTGGVDAVLESSDERLQPHLLAMYDAARADAAAALTPAGFDKARCRGLALSPAAAFALAFGVGGLDGRG